MIRSLCTDEYIGACRAGVPDPPERQGEGCMTMSNGVGGSQRSMLGRSKCGLRLGFGLRFGRGSGEGLRVGVGEGELIYVSPTIIRIWQISESLCTDQYIGACRAGVPDPPEKQGEGCTTMVKS